MLKTDYPAQECALARSLELVGGRWTLLILRDAFYGVQRFGEFAEHLDIPRSVLAERLRALVDGGLLERRPDPAGGAREVYAMTPDGEALWPALHALMHWGRRFADDPDGARRFEHAGCGVALDERGVCPKCGAAPGPREVTTVPLKPSPRREQDAVARALEPRRTLLEPLAVS